MFGVQQDDAQSQRCYHLPVLEVTGDFPSFCFFWFMKVLSCMLYAKHILLGFLALRLKDHRRRGQKRIVSDFIELEKDPPLPGTHTLLIVVNVIQAQKELK